MLQSLTHKKPKKVKTQQMPMRMKLRRVKVQQMLTRMKLKKVKMLQQVLLLEFIKDIIQMLI
jgi:hypothetical protein